MAKYELQISPKVLQADLNNLDWFCVTISLSSLYHALVYALRAHSRNITMDTIVSQIKDIVGKADKLAKDKMLDSLENLLVELRDPMDVLYSTYGAVCYIQALQVRRPILMLCLKLMQAIQMPIAKVGADIGIFRKLAELQPGSSRTVEQLADETGADDELLGKYGPCHPMC